jgi:urease accessory protein
LNGRLCLRAGVRDGRTVLLESQGTYPLQVMRPQPLGSTGLSLVLLLLSGGLLDGDDVCIDVVLEAGARLMLRTQAATQVHAGCSRQVVRATVGDGAWFSYVPRAVVPHAGASYVSQTLVTMEAGSRVLVGEPLAPGRVLFGEEFAYSRVQLEVDAYCGGRLVARERAVIRPGDASLRTAQFGPAIHTAGVYQLGCGESPVDSGAEGVWVGCTQLAHGGWYFRAVASRAAELDRMLERLAARWWQNC